MAKSCSFSGPFSSDFVDHSEGTRSSSSDEVSESLSNGASASVLRYRRQASLPALGDGNRNSSQKEVMVYDIRKHGHIAEPRNFEFKSVLRHTDIVNEVSKSFDVTETNVRLHLSKSCVIIMPQPTLPNQLILFLQCFPFEKGKHKQMCIQVDQGTQISQLHEIIERDLWSQGSEIYKDNSCLPSRVKILKDLEVNDFDDLQVFETKQVKVSFRYRMKADIEMRVSVNLNTSDSVKEVKKKIRTVLKDEPLFEIKADSVIQITTRKECLRDERCFGMLAKSFRDNGFWIHITAKDAVTCLLCYPKRRDKRRDEGKTIIFIDPTKPTFFVRNEAAKYAGVDAKSIELLTEYKEPVEEMDKIGDTNVIEKDCSLKVDINKKMPIVVQHPAKPEPDKIAHLYALEHVFSVRQLVAMHYGIDELHIVLKCNGELMQDNELLKKYSIKKTTVLQLQVFEKRIHITILILSKRRKMSLIIDDPSKSTVGDLLDFCANKNGYQSSNSKCLHDQRCLNNCSTLHTEGIQSGHLLIVVNFQDDENIPEGLFKLYAADQFGNIVVSIGTVIGGYLLQASDYKKTTYCENPDSKTERTSRCPDGIHIYECIFTAPVINTAVSAPSPCEQNLRTQYTRETYSTSSSSSGKEETCVKQLATSTSTHQQSKKSPRFFVGENEFPLSQSKSHRLNGQNKIKMQTAGQRELSGHSTESDCRPSTLNRHSVTELHLSYRHSGTVSGSVSDSALSTVHNVVRAFSPEQGGVVIPGEFLQSSGITVSLLEYVSRQIGTDWKRLARKLYVSDNDIAEIEHKYRELSEKCYQVLILWKKQKGKQASKQWLIQALKDISSNLLAENIEAMVEMADDSALGSGNKTE